MVRRLGWAVAAGLLAAALGPVPGKAADLVVGAAVEPDTIDPHFHWFGPDLDLSLQIFEPLVGKGADGKLQPRLAVSWKPLDDHSWVFNLRPGVTFHDGTKLTASDVAFSLRRAPDVPHSPSGFGPFLRNIADVETPAPDQVIVHTKGPVPLLPTYLSLIGIVSEHAGRDATTQDYNSGKAAIGTGAYGFSSWKHGDAIELTRHDGYWGAAPAWAHARLRFIPNPAARVAALRAGDVDLIDGVSVENVAELRADPRFRVRDAVSNNVIAFQLDVARRKPPFVTGPNGETLDDNPLADRRVRQALALAVNRDALKDRVMNGEAAVAAQVMAPGQFGYDPDLPKPVYDPAAAKRLLAEAGWPSGFRLTMHCQADRYPKGTELCQAAAQMFTRIGVQATPTAMPHSMFIGHANKHEYSLFTMFMLNDTEEPSSGMAGMFATQDPAKGRGTLNRGQYSNTVFDGLLDQAAHEVDAQQREATLRKAVGIMEQDVAWIPLLRQLNIEAMRAGIDHTPRGDGYVFVADVINAKP